MTRYLYSELANLVDARRRCLSGLKDGQLPNPWADKHTERIEALVKEHMPSGSGFDSGTTMDLDASHGDRLVFNTAFHHMDEGGGYDGWTEHRVVVTPAFVGGFNLRVSGRNRNEIKEYVAEAFQDALSSELPARYGYEDARNWVTDWIVTDLACTVARNVVSANDGAEVKR